MSLKETLSDFTASRTKFRVIFLCALSLFLIGIPFSRFLMSLGGIVLFANWVLEGGVIEKFKRAFQSKAIWACLLLYFVHIIWLISSQNLRYGIEDLWIKIPMFFMPIIFFTTQPLSRKEFETLLQIYIIGVFISTFSGFMAYIFGDMNDKRDMALYISYVRFGINICFACFVCLFLLFKTELTSLRKVFMAILLCWLLFFMAYSGSMTAIVLLFFIGTFFVIWQTIKSTKKIFRYGIPALFLFLVTGSSYSLYVIVKAYFDADFSIETAAKYTPGGNPYVHDTSMHYIENGSYIYTYICDVELERAWNKKSRIDFHELDKNGFPIRTTLIRYLNSKGLHKDSQGVVVLTQEDISNIEQGIANVSYTYNFNIINRIYELMWEMSDYYNTGMVTGYSMVQRFELWKNSIELIKKYPYVGVGTGDVKDAFAEELASNNSPLAGTNMRSHNQYFTFLIAFGFIGLLLILFSFIYPPIVLRKNHLLFWIFFFIVLLSMFTEDTLEPQDGATFFAFFYSFFLFLAPQKRRYEAESSARSSVVSLQSMKPKEH